MLTNFIGEGSELIKRKQSLKLKKCWWILDVPQSLPQSLPGAEKLSSEGLQFEIAQVNLIFRQPRSGSLYQQTVLGLGLRRQNVADGMKIIYIYPVFIVDMSRGSFEARVPKKSRLLRLLHCLPLVGRCHNHFVMKFFKFARLIAAEIDKKELGSIAPIKPSHNLHGKTIDFSNLTPGINVQPAPGLGPEIYNIRK